MVDNPTDQRDRIWLDGQEFTVENIFRVDDARGEDWTRYVVEGYVYSETDVTNLSPTDSFELTLTHESAINLVANLMELINKVGE